MYKIIAFILGILLVTSCQYKYMEQLKDLDNRLETQADFVLDSLKKINVSRLKKAEKVYYDLLWASAADKNMISQPQDSILTEADIYYTKKHDVYNQIRVKYYIAKHVISKGEKKSGYNLLKQAELLLMDTDEKYPHLKALIHYQLAREQSQLLNYESAKYYGNKSLNNFIQAKDTVSAVHALKFLSNISMYEKKYIEAKMYLQKGLTLLNNYDVKHGKKIDEVKAGLLNSLSLLYRNMSDFKTALKYNQKSIETFSRSGDEVLSEYYYTRLSIFVQLNQNDSARFYCGNVIKAAQEAKKYINLLNGYRYLAKIEERQSNYQEACRLKDTFNYYKDLYNKEYNSIELMKLEKEYAIIQQEKAIIQSQYNNLRVYFVLAILLFIILISGSAYYIRHRDLKRKYAELIKEAKRSEWGFNLTKELIIENNTAYDQLEHLLYRSKLNNFDSKLYDEFGSTIDDQREHYSDKLLRTLVQFDQTFVNKLKHVYKRLPSQDIMMACMIRHGWKNIDIAAVFHVSNEAVRKRKSRLEHKISQKLKQKIKLEEFLCNL